VPTPAAHTPDAPTSAAPTPSFDTDLAVLLEQARKIGDDFDTAFYSAAYPDLDFTTESPAMHYCRTGRREGRNPAPWFSTEDYLRHHPEVLRADTNPFLHYLERGRQEGRTTRRTAPHSEPFPNVAKIRARRFGPVVFPFLGTAANVPGNSDIGLNAETRLPIQQAERPDGISVVILTVDKPQFIIPLLRQLVAAQEEMERHNLPLEILVGDTGSTDQRVLMAYDELASKIKLIRGFKYQFSTNNNSLFSMSSYNRVLFCNNDVKFPDVVFSLTIMAHELDTAGIVGSHLFFPDGRVQHGGVEVVCLGENRTASAHHLGGQTFARPQPGFAMSVAAVTGAVMMIKAQLFIDLDGFDARFDEECQDLDLCLAARRLGARVRLVYAGDIIHFENGTRSPQSANARDRARLARKWASFTEVMGGTV
jgi:GT2 family glycosyltransferase